MGDIDKKASLSAGKLPSTEQLRPTKAIDNSIPRATPGISLKPLAADVVVGQKLPESNIATSKMSQKYSSTDNIQTKGSNGNVSRSTADLKLSTDIKKSLSAPKSASSSSLAQNTQPESSSAYVPAPVKKVLISTDIMFHN